MPRNKSAKRASKKRQKASNNKKPGNKMVNIKKMEMELMQTPSRMAAQLNKEINANKKQEARLTKAIKKANQQMNKAETRIQTASSKTTAAAKKQLKVARKIHDQASKSQATVSKQLEAVMTTLDELTSAQSKFMAIGKSMNQFCSEWTKAAKKNKSTAKPQGTKTKNKSGSNLEPLMQPVEETIDTGLDEVTEMAS